MYTNRYLSGIYKGVSLTQEKKNNIIYIFGCHYGSHHVEKTSKKFYLRIDQNVPKLKKAGLMVDRKNLRRAIFCD